MTIQELNDYCASNQIYSYASLPEEMRDMLLYETTTDTEE